MASVQAPFGGSLVPGPPCAFMLFQPGLPKHRRALQRITSESRTVHALLRLHRLHRPSGEPRRYAALGQRNSGATYVRLHSPSIDLRLVCACGMIPRYRLTSIGSAGSSSPRCVTRSTSVALALQSRWSLPTVSLLWWSGLHGKQWLLEINSGSFSVNFS